MSHKGRQCHLRSSDSRFRLELTMDKMFGDGTGKSVVVQKAFNAYEGPEAEERFEDAWKRSLPAWLKEVRKSLPHEDQHEHTDFFFVLNVEGNPFELRIDIKASLCALKKFEQEHPKLLFPVIFIVVGRNLSEQEIRKETIKRVRVFLRENHREQCRWFEKQKPRP